MHPDHPQTPQSPSQASFGAADPTAKPATSPRFTHSLPTPAHSINGSMSSLASDSALESQITDDVSNKRKRDLEDHGEREQKKIHVEDSRYRMEDLHLPVGEKYLLCRTPHPVAKPQCTQDLFELYGTNRIAQHVARTHADGSKNPIRKTYKGFLKSLGLSGAFDVEVNTITAGDPGTLYDMVSLPPPPGEMIRPFKTDAYWQQEAVQGKDIQDGLSDTVMKDISRALTMSRGIIPKSELWDSSVLGEIATMQHAPPKVAPNGAKTPVPFNTVPGRVAKGDISRPKRNQKKRSYGDASYEGYGEGYLDDDNHEMGYSTGDGDDKGRKRPKKTAPPHSFQNQGPMRQNSYGPGMVGV